MLNVLLYKLTLCKSYKLVVAYYKLQKLITRSKNKPYWHFIYILPWHSATSLLQTYFNWLQPQWKAINQNCDFQFDFVPIVTSLWLILYLTLTIRVIQRLINSSWNIFFQKIFGLGSLAAKHYELCCTYNIKISDGSVSFEDKLEDVE